MSNARPPAGAPEETTSSYGILGVRGETIRQGFTFSANVSGGHALENGNGRWLWVQSDVQHELGRLGVFWLDYREAFDFGTVGAQIQPQFRFAKGALTARPLAALSRWTSDTITTTYGVLGGALQWQQPVGRWVLRLTGDAYTAGNNGYASGGYASLGASVYTLFGQTTIGAGASVARTPLETESGFNVWASRQLSERLRIDALVSRSITDALFGTPGALGFTAMLSWRVHQKLPPPRPQLASVGQAVRRGRVVEFNVLVPKTAKTVAVSGTFSDWRPIALRRNGSNWIGKVTVEPGTHQFGFLIDGKDWFVPEDAADVVDDGFGRKNVTLIVRPK